MDKKLIMNQIKRLCFSPFGVYVASCIGLWLGEQFNWVINDILLVITFIIFLVSLFTKMNDYNDDDPKFMYTIGVLNFASIGGIFMLIVYISEYDMAIPLWNMLKLSLLSFSICGTSKIAFTRFCNCETMF